MGSFTFVQLDHRAASRASVLADLAAIPTLGIEVTEADLARACVLGNIDPQHGFGNFSADGRALDELGLPATAISIATITLGCEPSRIVFSRPDADSIGAAAVRALRYLAVTRADSYRAFHPTAEEFRDRLARIRRIAQSDAFRGGAWKPAQLPTVLQPWPRSERVTVDGDSRLATIAAICSPRPGQPQYPLAQRVALMAAWITWGDALLDTDHPVHDFEALAPIFETCGAMPAEGGSLLAWVTDALVRSRDMVSEARLALCREVDRPGAIHYWDATHGQKAAGPCDVAVVRVRHAGAMGVGYCAAPVCVAFDPATPGKVTIGAYDDGRLDFAALRARLNEMEVKVGGSPTWGGPHNMCCSPQGCGTKLGDAVIADAVIGEVREMRRAA